MARLRIRLLPLTMVGIGLLFTVKVMDILYGGEKFAEAFLVSSVSAQQEEAQVPEEAVAKPEEPVKPEMGAALIAGKKEVVIPTAASIIEGGKGLSPQARYFSPIELELLETLSSRRAQLDMWAKEVEVKENLLKVTEERIDRKIASIEEMRAQLEEMLVLHKTEEDAKIRSLVKIYEAMKARDAARIFDEIEMPILLMVIDQMAEKKAAPILAAMNPQKAKQLTVELAEQRRMQNELMTNISRTTAPIK